MTRPLDFIEAVIKFLRPETVGTLFLLMVVTKLLTGCMITATNSPAVVCIKVLDHSGHLPVTNAVLSAVHPLSSDLVEARTDTDGRAILHFRFIAHPFVIGVHREGRRMARISIFPDRATTNIVGEAYLDFETEIDARKGIVRRKPMK